MLADHPSRILAKVPGSVNHLYFFSLDEKNSEAGFLLIGVSIINTFSFVDKSFKLLTTQEKQLVPFFLGLFQSIKSKWQLPVQKMK